ncbi:MAG: ABC transporter ATP-binding protein [Oscillospiraceae bacterium]|jgi:ABC-2 type transport system ATP-binding protein|nr:ABC transporter ATP-binding protein [Oscillospiraceae bacterium]
MIDITSLTKQFDKTPALDGLELHVKKGSIYGLIGVNGSGKTTALKIVTGILRPDIGEARMDGEPVYDNLSLKARMGFIPDELFFFGSYSLTECASFYKRLFPGWNAERFAEMKERFALPERRRVTRFSKGMQKQAAFMLTMSAMPDFLILDEPIDGLDPLVRKLVWKYIVDDVAARSMTVLVSSHNLREMEGICDSIGILHRGKMLIERDLDELKSDLHKVQVAFPEGSGSGADNAAAAVERYNGLELLHRETRGTVELLIIRAPEDIVRSVIGAQNPLIFDLLPLSLEEIFMYELGGEHSELGAIIF